MLGRMLMGVLKVVLGHLEFADGKNVLTSSQAFGTILVGVALVCFAGALLLSPDVVHAIAPWLPSQTAEALFLSAIGVIWGGVRYLIGKRAMDARLLTGSGR